MADLSVTKSPKWSILQAVLVTSYFLLLASAFILLATSRPLLFFCGFEWRKSSNESESSQSVDVCLHTAHSTVKDFLFCCCSCFVPCPFKTFNLPTMGVRYCAVYLSSWPTVTNSTKDELQYCTVQHGRRTKSTRRLLFWFADDRIESNRIRQIQ